MALRVFLSHTSEFRRFPAGGSYIAALESAVSAGGDVVVDMREFPAIDQTPAAVCQERVRSCAVVVGVYGTRYGSPVRDRPEVSYTELEFDTASDPEHPLERLVFLLDEEAENPGIPAKWLNDPLHGERQRAFLNKVREAGLTLKTFRNPDDQARLVERSLVELKQRRRAEREGGGPRERLVSRALAARGAAGGGRFGVFLSYARSDGEAFANELRERLKQDLPSLRVWQDRPEIEGGVGWWRQIETALDQVEFLVSVMTPAALASEITAREWRAARQRGVCVFPVQGPGFDFADPRLPRWMAKAHFYDLDKQWDTFLAHLTRGCQAARVPFMAPDLPVGFVQRSGNSRRCAACCWIPSGAIRWRSPPPSPAPAASARPPWPLPSATTTPSSRPSTTASSGSPWARRPTSPTPWPSSTPASPASAPPSRTRRMPPPAWPRGCSRKPA